MLSHVIRELLLPPASLLLLLALGLGLRQRQPRLAMAAVGLACGLLYILSIPPVAFALTRSTETRPALTLAQIREFQPQAVVILGGGVDFDAAEYDGMSVPSAGSLKRITYAAYLSKALALPVITTGGYGETREDSEGQTAAWQLAQGGIGDVLVEAESKNTRENALLSKKVAAARNIDRVLLVTHSAHAARAEAAFTKAGFECLAAPTGFRSRQPWERGILLLLPTHSHFDESCRALRAHLAMLYETLRG